MLKLLPVLALALLPAAASARVVFTGYADFRATAAGRLKLEGPSSVLAGLNTAPGTTEQRSSNIDALGLFATSSLGDATRLQMDITYRDIGVNARTIRIQYAFIEQDWGGWLGRAGKITLPFGYYNQERFYAFKRPSITAPIFQNGILGMPIADVGGLLRRRQEFGELWAAVDAYAVNGYGPLSGSSVSFRNPGLPGALAISNNITGRSTNHRFAYGGRLSGGHQALPNSELGASYYGTVWDPQGNSRFHMGNAHVHADFAGVDLLAEYLYMNVRGDQGSISTVGQNWRTDGVFVIADYRRLKVGGKPIVPWLRYEHYLTQGENPGRERLWAPSVGAALQALEGLQVKAELIGIYYKIPFTAGDVKLAGWTSALALVATF